MIIGSSQRYRVSFFIYKLNYVDSSSIYEAYAVSVHVVIFLFVAPASGMGDIGIWFSVHSFVCPSTFATTLASTLLSGSLTLKACEILWQNLVQI